MQASSILQYSYLPKASYLTRKKGQLRKVTNPSFYINVYATKNSPTILLGLRFFKEVINSTPCSLFLQKSFKY